MCLDRLSRISRRSSCVRAHQAAVLRIGMRAAERAARDGVNLERELLGITYGHLRMVDRGYVLVGELAYGAGHGLDMIFRKANANGGWTYAVLEAKGGDSLGRLGTAGGFTQGSARYIEYQLNEFLRARGLNITAAEHALVRELQAGLSAGTVCGVAVPAGTTMENVPNVIGGEGALSVTVTS